MTSSLIVGCLWVLGAAITAMLPMRRQYLPGFVLLGLAPILLIWISVVHGVLWGFLGLLGFISMFRNPLIYFWKRWTGPAPDRPGDHG
jgi:hypothetical protein